MAEQALTLAGLALAGALPAIALVITSGRRVWWLLGGLAVVMLVAIIAMALSPARWGVLGWVAAMALSPVLLGALAGAGIAAFWKERRDDRR